VVVGVTALATKTALTSVPVDPWEPTNITLRDAALLCRQLTAAARGEKDPVSAIGAYEVESVPHGFARVADSLKSNGTYGEDPLYHPVKGRFALAAARGYFHMTGKIPAMRRTFLAQMETYRGE
jgi:hypothetical protein